MDASPTESKARGASSSSRIVKGENGETYTTGVIVQSNYGHTRDLRIGGVPIGKLLVKERTTPEDEAAISDIPGMGSGKADDGSIIIYLM